jgi:cation/acetate symporter
VIYESSMLAVAVFSIFVGSVLVLSFWLGSKAKSAKGYYAAHGSVHWFVNGIAFAGDYLSAASFLGICGMIAFNGYDGFLYSIGYLAGWIVALFVIAEPLKRMGKFTFADALDKKFNSRGIKLAAAISTLLVSLFYLIPQMVGAGALITPLFGFPHFVGVLLVGAVVVVIVVTAGMVSTTYVQFIKGSLLVFFCTILTVMILNRGYSTKPEYGQKYHEFRTTTLAELQAEPGVKFVPPDQGWIDRPYVRTKNADGVVAVWRKDGEKLREAQSYTTTKDAAGVVSAILVNGKPQGKKVGEHDFYPVGNISELPGGKTATGPLGPLEYFSVLQDSKVLVWRKDKLITEKTSAGTAETLVFYPVSMNGSDLMIPGVTPTFAGIKSEKTTDKLNFISLMLALFCGTASLPHILIRYYTVKDQASARKSTVVGIASIGFFYVLTLYLGLGAMTSGRLDVTDSTMSAPLLAKSFGELPFAVVSAIAFTTVLGTVSGLILAASGAVAHDIMTNYMKMDMDDHAKVRAGKIVAIVVGAIAMLLGILFKEMNPSFLVGWAFNIAASANLPSLAMLLFWKKTTKQGITAAITVGLLSSLGWILLSKDAYQYVYRLSTDLSPVPFSQPAIITIPLGFIVLIIVSLLTQKKDAIQPVAQELADAK